MDEPLATVLTAAAEDAYQCVATLLWKLKRAEHALGAAWVLLNAMQRQLARLAARARTEGLVCPGAHMAHGINAPPSVCAPPGCCPCAARALLSAPAALAGAPGCARAQ